MITDSEDKIMIAELERIIRDEEAKPASEQDTVLIDECIREIAELKSVKAEFSEEEVTGITDDLIKVAKKEQKRKRFFRLAAGIAAAVVLVTGISACTINPALINWIIRICQAPFGSIVEQESVTYYYEGTTEKYNSIEQLLKANDLDVYYPTVLPNQAKFKAITLLDEDGVKTLACKFTSIDFRYTIQLQYINPKAGGEKVAEVETSELHFDVYSKDGRYISVAEDDGNTYIVQSSNVDDIILFVSGLRKEKK